MKKRNGNKMDWEGKKGKPMTTVTLRDHHPPLVSIATVATDSREPFSPGHEWWHCSRPGTHFTRDEQFSQVRITRHRNIFHETKKKRWCLTVQLKTLDQKYYSDYWQGKQTYVQLHSTKLIFTPPPQWQFYQHKMATNCENNLNINAKLSLNRGSPSKKPL